MEITSQTIKKLLYKQMPEWTLAKTNYEALQHVKMKEYHFGNFNIKVQFNPARIQSTAAKTDNKSTQERKCFLCPENLPIEQNRLPFNEEYQILVNPFPIIPLHFTIPAYKHVDQSIVSRYNDMLDMARCFDEFTIFYNGPKAGASAPDHAHFQAGIKGFFPLEKDIKNIRKDIILKTEETIVYTIKNYLRKCFLIETPNKQATISIFNNIYSSLELKSDDKEPKMNLITWFENNTWYSCIFPRETHRPACFYVEGEDNLLVSPGAVDLGGVLILPLEKDFDKITAENIKLIFNEISITDEQEQSVIHKLKEHGA